MSWVWGAVIGMLIGSSLTALAFVVLEEMTRKRRESG
jgi:hypothetical protein